MLTDLLQSILTSDASITEMRTFNKAEDFLHTGWQPDIIVTDILMPGLSGMELLEIVKEKNYTSKVLILSGITDVQTIKQAIRSGAAGYLSKNTSLEELTAAIAAIHNCEQYISNKLRNSLLNTVFTEEQVVFHLSPREKDVLELICSGHTVKEAAYKLNLSAHTVHSYHKSIMKKFKVNRTADLIVFAMQKGLYSPTTS
ncbi:DNA-binding response regulator, LuxR family [Filimonas lacunae]|nr:DNA-binding response regulator, LuxR family [Filimonas lacunae]